MNEVENNKQQVSLLMDDLHQDEQVLDKVMQDQDLKDTWARFNLVRDVINDDYAGPESLSISDRVAKALDSETSHSQMSEPEAAKVIKFPNLFKQAGGFAVAASVCAFVLLGVQYQPNNQLDAVPQSQLVTSAPKTTLSPFVQRSVAPVSLQQRPNIQELQQRQRLQQMLSEHFIKAQKYSGSISLPYVTIAGTPIALEKRVPRNEPAVNEESAK